MLQFSNDKQTAAWLRKIVIVLGLLLLSPMFALGQDHVLINSADWKDVYSGILYANLLGVPNSFLTSTPHGAIILYEIPTDRKNIQIITSADKPFVVGYESLIRSRGYENPEETIYEQANLELAKLLTDINKFIIIDSSYGYNAIAVAPYAVKAGYYVLFADSRNIAEIDDFLATKNVEDIILYGHLDREVRSALAKYSPESINSESGSRFENNMKIVDKYAEIGSIKQVILSNGEFIEASMMSGREAVLFIGKTNVPDEIQQYIKGKGIEIGVLIGNELIGSATTIRRQLGISVFVKFARGARIPGGTINPVEDLDRFPMPSYQLSITIVSISYNRATGMLEVTYINNADIASYLKGTITIKGANGETIGVVGDQDVVFIDAGETKTISYVIDIPQNELGDNLTADVYTIYGESKTSLEQALRGSFKIETITVTDDTDIEIIEVVYDKASGKFLVTIQNTGSVDAYVDVELVDLWINGEYVTVSADDIIKIGPGQKKVIGIKVDMSEEDLNDPKNAKITVRAVYGARKHALVKSKEKEFDLKMRAGFVWWYIPVILVILIIILLIILLIFRRRKRCPRCRTMNKKRATHCRKCGYHFGESHGSSRKID
ncbi:MAG TPA: hypothetical protein VJ461_04150 [Candidatus Nanoarchaeia archaeon]|nr:hypothetical protein [Candidatus Nanoarchaeia archaeon]